MRTSYIITAFAIVLIVVFLSGCAQKADHNIVSRIDYDISLCDESTGYHYKPGGFDTGLRVILKDKSTGENIEGYATFSFGGLKGVLSVDETYSCEEQIDSQDAIVSVYSKGYTPMAFELDLLKNQLATVEVSMMKSCSGGPTCFDNLRIGLLERAGGNQSEAEEIIAYSQNRFFDTIQRNFGLEKSDYELSCMECNMGQEGYIKAKGTYKDGSPFELYYHWGWCNSGGSDCGWSACFSSEEPLFTSIKNKLCSKIYSYNLKEYITQENIYNMEKVDIMHMIKVNDTTNEIRKECLDSKFEVVKDNQKSISVIQGSNRRYRDWVTEGNTDCLSN